MTSLLRRLHSLLRRVVRLFQSDPNAFLKKCRAVVHVGANYGQEREQYAKYDLAVLWIEPIPEIHKYLVENIKPYKKQRAIRALVTDRDGEVRHLNIASNDGASSSIFEFALHRDIWPD